MATYVNDLRLKEIATGDEAGTWGTSTNTNLELIAEAFSFGTEAITTNADTHTTTIADGSTDPGRSLYLKYTGTLDSACTITIGPNTVSKLWFIENGTSGSQNIIISQGSGANITIPAGDVKVVYSDGAGAGAAVVDAFASLNVVDLKVQDDLTVTDDMTVGGTLGVTGIVTLTDDLIIGDGKTIGSASDVDAMTIASNGQVTFTQTLIGTALDISGDIDVDGTTNLDVVDIDGAVDMASTLGVTGVVTANAGVVVDEITIDGDTITATDDFIIDAADDITLDADGGDIFFKDGGTQKMHLDATGRLLIGADSGDAFNADAMLRLQRTGDRIFQSFKVDADQEAAIFFGDVDDDIECGIQYQAANKNLIFSTGNNSEAMRIDSAGTIYQGTTTPTLHSAQRGIVFENGCLTNDITRGAGKSMNLAQNAAIDSGNTFAYLATDEASLYQQFGGNHYFYTAPSGSAGADITFGAKLFIGNTGNVGISTTAPDGKLHISETSGSATTAYITNSVSTADSSTKPLLQLQFNGDASLGTGTPFIKFANQNDFIGSITGAASSTAYNTSSDYRLKENVDYTWDATTRLKQLKPARFNFIADADTTVDGFLAHEVSSIVPEAITGEKDAIDSEGNPDYQGIDQSKLVPLLVKTIQELEARITALES